MWFNVVLDPIVIQSMDKITEFVFLRKRPVNSTGKVVLKCAS